MFIAHITNIEIQIRMFITVALFRYTQVGIQFLAATVDTAKSLIHKDSRNPQLALCSILRRL